MKHRWGKEIYKEGRKAGEKPRSDDISACLPALVIILPSSHLCFICVHLWLPVGAVSLG